MLVVLLFAGFVSVCSPAPLMADEDVESVPGLLATYSDGSSVVRRMDRRLSFDWAGASADARLDNDFQAHWSGLILIRQPGLHQLHAALAGHVEITIGDQKMLTADSDGEFVSGELLALPVGDHPISIRYQSRSHQNSKLQLFWSSPAFTLEPLPPDTLTSSVLADESTDAAHVSESKSSDRGRFVADALRCSACHAGLGEMTTLAAPSLQQVSGDSIAHLVRRLIDPKDLNPHSNMPAFGFTETQAQDVAAFLLKAGQKAGQKSGTGKTPKFKPDDAAAGSKLLLTLGCVACHAVKDGPEFEPLSSPYQGPDLKTAGIRRSATWLMTWLKNPESLNADHRMPVFDLSEDEQRQLAAALVAQSSGITEAPAVGEFTGNADEGRKLVVAANCRSCHQIPGIETSGKMPRPRWSESSPVDTLTSRSCVAQLAATDSTDQRSAVVSPQPHYSMSNADQNAIRDWLRTVTSDLHEISRSTKGELLLHRHGCIACHDRDQHAGLSSVAGAIEGLRDDLRGQSQALIPPALTAVGDRLRQETLTAVVTGNQQARRLPWLLVRMPKFKFSNDDHQAIVQHFIASDRIPDAADKVRPELFEHYNPDHPVSATPDDLLMGNQLIGAAGFNCIACHKAGPFEPRNVAMGTRGSDIMTMGQRIRPRYFLRWMQNPIRIVPGIEMPAIRKAVPGVLHDSLPKQFSIMWTALSDANFSPPTVVSRYEQIVNVSPGERPRVLRDVFTIGNSKPGDSKSRNSVARTLAAGFENGHNVLIDLDRMQLRQWTIGEFARERTEGKSWFWDMAGVILSDQAADHLLVKLKRSGHDALLSPAADELRQAELLSWKTTSDSVNLRVRYRFEPNPPDQPASDLGTRSRHTALTHWTDPSRSFVNATVLFTLQPWSPDSAAAPIVVSPNQPIPTTGLVLTAKVEDCPSDASLVLSSWVKQSSETEFPWQTVVHSDANSGVELRQDDTESLTLVTSVTPPSIELPKLPQSVSTADQITSVPGFNGTRLPIETAIMPTSMTMLDDGRLAFTSLRGHVWVASDSNGDGIHDALSLFAEGLSAPYGIQADGDSLLVSHKPEVVRLRDSDGDGTADEFDVFASGWGFSDDYHDWTTGLARDDSGNYFVGLGSDYGTQARTRNNDRWRGTILKIDSNGTAVPVAYSFRYPMGLAFNADGHLFATDNQGVQNTFNEINHIIHGKHYGVPSRFETVRDATPEIPSVMVPHPWTRSVNAITFFPKDYPVAELAGHGIGCEYDTRCLIRFTIQDVNGSLQGASYRFSLPDQEGGGSNFVGPISTTFGPDGSLFIGSIWDSGWQGGTNTGSIERIRPSAKIFNGIREIRATPTGFDVSFFHPVDADKATDEASWNLQAYTRQWSGNYASPDSDRHSLAPSSFLLSDDRRTVSFDAGPFKAGYVYEVRIQRPLDGSDAASFWPNEGHYSMKTVPGN